MAFYGNDKKYKEPDDLDLLRILHMNWDTAWKDLSEYIMNPALAVKKNSAIKLFLVVYGEAGGDLMKNPKAVIDMKEQNLIPLPSLQSMKDGMQLYNIFYSFNSILFNHGVLSFQKRKDTNVGGHSGPE
jgi:hypothetical protein